MSLSPRLREALPLGLRRILRRGQRAASDWIRWGDLSAPPPQSISAWDTAAAVVQPLGTTPNSDAKIHNVALACAVFSSRPIAPGRLFSFWRWLGSPSSARGFQDGRALRGGRLVLEPGGGLCQLAGALYYAGLQAGLQVAERHAHSVDLYTDDTRYAPLGSDATVSFGFRDLRLLNPHPCAVAFDAAIDGATLRVRVLSESVVAPSVPEFRRYPLRDGSMLVETWAGGAMIARTSYGRLPNSATSGSRVSPDL